MEILEVFEDSLQDVKKSVGKEGFLLLILGVVAIFVIVLMSQSKNEESNVVVASGITSYPDVVTNADVIISTLQNSIEYSQDEIMEETRGLFADSSELISGNFDATNNYINEGFEKQKELADKNHNETMDAMENMYTFIGSETQKINENIAQSTQGIHEHMELENDETNRHIDALADEMKNQFHHQVDTLKGTIVRG